MSTISSASRRVPSLSALPSLVGLGCVLIAGACGSSMDEDSASGLSASQGASDSAAQGSESGASGDSATGVGTDGTTAASDGSATSASGATQGSDGATDSDSDGVTAGEETTGGEDTATSGGEDTTTGGENTTGGEDTTTTGGEDTTTTTTGGEDTTTTGGEDTTTGGDVPDFVADCDDDPQNPIIVTVKPDVTARFPSITAGLAAATDGSVIEVCPGTYSEKIEVTLDITLRGAGPDATIIDGGGFYFDLGDGAALVEGFGFTHCNAKIPSGWKIASSGAISVNDTYGAQEKLTIRDCHFYDNKADYGAGMHIDGSNNGGKNPDIFIEDSVFEGNVAVREGGAIASHGRVHIKSSVFLDNQAGTGGALALSYGCTGPSVCDISDSIIHKNHTTGSKSYEGGGGLFIDDCGLDCLSGIKVTNSDFGFGAAEENTDYQGLAEDILINNDGDPWNRYGWYYNGVTFTCANGSCSKP